MCDDLLGITQRLVGQGAARSLVYIAFHVPGERSIPDAGTETVAVGSAPFQETAAVTADRLAEPEIPGLNHLAYPDRESISTDLDDFGMVFGPGQVLLRDDPEAQVPLLAA